jgi:hypothetical protein
MCCCLEKRCHIIISTHHECTVSFLPATAAQLLISYQAGLSRLLLDCFHMRQLLELLLLLQSYCFFVEHSTA